MGTPYNIYKNPATQFVSFFVGENTMIKDYNRIHGFEGTSFTGAIIRPEFIEAFKSDNPRFKDMVGISEKGTITDILFRGSSYEVILDVNGVQLKTYRSLERRPIKVGEQMNVIIYRMYAYDSDGMVHLLENHRLSNMVKEEGPFEAYLYSNAGYFII